MNSNSLRTFKASATFIALTLLFILNTPTATAASNICAAQGKNQVAAKQSYAQSCIAPVKDCDRIDGIWVCASKNINKNNFSLDYFNTNASEIPNNKKNTEHVIALNTYSTNDTDTAVVCNDPDNDGWGWTGSESYKVVKPTPVSIDPTGNGTQGSSNKLITNYTTTLSPCDDPDGDGWGWTGTESCKVGESDRDTSEPNISVITHTPYNYRPVVTNNSNSTSRVPDNCKKLNAGNYHITELVTDVFLSAGQSNAAGGQTVYNPWSHRKDRVNARIIVWTENNRWEVADPDSQTWHNEKYPKGQNHPAFQIARSITDNDKCRVVAFIATAASGMPIDHWRNDVDGHYSSILQKVPTALNALPGKYKIDMIWWMQGEADDDQYVERYFYKLTDLINRFRSENWFDSDGFFLANETRTHLYANEAIRMLTADANPFTDFSRGSDTSDMRFPSIKPAGVHFNATSLRQIGDLVAGKYLYEYLPRVNR